MESVRGVHNSRHKVNNISVTIIIIITVVTYLVCSSSCSWVLLEPECVVPCADMIPKSIQLELFTTTIWEWQSHDNVVKKVWQRLTDQDSSFRWDLIIPSHDMSHGVYHRVRLGTSSSCDSRSDLYTTQSPQLWLQRVPVSEGGDTQYGAKLQMSVGGL